jgi:hypothetical protein
MGLSQTVGKVRAGRVFGGLYSKTVIYREETEVEKGKC